MTERFMEFHMERDGSKFNYVTIDLESVVSFMQDSDISVQVITGPGMPTFLPVTYADFKKLHKAYHDSKLPTVNTPSSWSPPVGNVEAKLTTTASNGEWTNLPPSTGTCTTDHLVPRGVSLSDEVRSSLDKIREMEKRQLDKEIAACEALTKKKPKKR